MPLTNQFVLRYKQFFGENPAISHFVNLLLLFLTAVLITKVLAQLFLVYTQIITGNISNKQTPEKEEKTEAKVKASASIKESFAV